MQTSSVQTSPALAPVAAPQLAGHIPALDAVRGLAILMVTAFRFFPVYDDPSLAGRYASRLVEFGNRGVDLFFVLSGFLITGILWDAKNRAHYFRDFYARRALRIFPLYYAALVITLLILPAFGLATSREFACGDQYAPWLWLYGTNILQSIQGSWCLGAFNHFWSLAVEEHFYLVWPLVIYFCSRRAAITVCIAAIVLSMVSRGVWLYSGGNEIAAQVFTPFRVDALALGGLLAFVARSPGGLKTIRPWAIAVCLAIFVSMLPPIQLHKRVPALRETLYAFLCAGVIVLAVIPVANKSWTRLWKLPALRFFGKYSYGMYVVQNFLKAAIPPEVVIAGIATVIGSVFWSRCTYLALMSIATVAAALLSWNLLEKHFLHLKHYFEPKQSTDPPREPVLLQPTLRLAPHTAE
ncbi:MAG: acyltransferase family protein [Pirellulales bacterium]